MRFTTSVVIPCYLPRPSASEIDLLHKAIKSAVDQDYPDDMEIILVDDGNPIPVDKLINTHDYGCEVRVIKQPRNMGLVLGLNKGINEAKYNFIARLDADDTWSPGKVRAQYDVFKSDSDVTLVATGMVRVTPSGDIIDEHIRPNGWANIAKFFVEYGCPFPHGSVLARKDTYKALGLYSQDATFAHCEDYHLWGQWIRFFKAAMIEKSYYNYTVSSSSVSGQNASQQMKASQIVLHHFRALGADKAYFDNFDTVASLLNISVVEVGYLLLRMWKSTGSVLRIPIDLLQNFRNLLPDRSIIETEHVETVQVYNLSEVSKSTKCVNVYIAFA